MGTMIEIPPDRPAVLTEEPEVVAEVNPRQPEGHVEIEQVCRKVRSER